MGGYFAGRTGCKKIDMKVDEAYGIEQALRRSKKIKYCQDCIVQNR